MLGLHCRAEMGKGYQLELSRMGDFTKDIIFHLQSHGGGVKNQMLYHFG